MTDITDLISFQPFKELAPYFRHLKLKQLVGFHLDYFTENCKPIDKIRMRVFCEEVLSQFTNTLGYIDSGLVESD
jgi:hypothetical protein